MQNTIIKDPIKRIKADGNQSNKRLNIKTYENPKIKRKHKSNQNTTEIKIRLTIDK